MSSEEKYEKLVLKKDKCVVNILTKCSILTKLAERCQWGKKHVLVTFVNFKSIFTNLCIHLFYG